MTLDTPESIEQEIVAPAVDFLRLAGQSRPDYLSPGAYKEKLRKRQYSNHPDRSDAVTQWRSGNRKTPLSTTPYAELRAASAFSFLDGASLPEDLIQRAAELDLPAVALLDRNGVYGAPRFYQAARQAGIKAIVGAEVVLEDPSLIETTGISTSLRRKEAELRSVGTPAALDSDGPHSCGSVGRHPGGVGQRRTALAWIR
jgi:hypothetical protein